MRNNTISKDKSNSNNAVQTFIIFAFSVLFWELFLYFQNKGAGASFSPWIILFAIAEAAVCTFICGWFKKDGANKAVMILLTLILWVFYVAQLMYHRIFGSFFSLSMAGMAGNAIENFGWTLIAAIKESVFQIFITLFPVGICILFAIFYHRKSKFSVKRHMGILAFALLLWVVSVVALPLGGTNDSTAYGAYYSSLVDLDTSCSKLGLLANSVVEFKNKIFGYTNDNSELIPSTADQQDDRKPDKTDNISAANYNIREEIDFNALASATSDRELKNISLYLAGTQPSNKNEYTGMFEGYNLIYICAEAFSSYAIDKDVTPTLYKLANEGIVLNNYYNSFKNVTTNGEYAFLNGLWPDVSRSDAGDGTVFGSFAQSIQNSMPMGMGKVFKEQNNAAAWAYHNYFGYYYARDQYLPNIGFTCKFMGDGMFFSTLWPASDYEMMLQSVDDYINEDQFCVYYMTFSGHGKYTYNNVMLLKNIGTVYQLKPDSGLTEEAMGYLACNHELELAMSYLMKRLEAAGKLENTVIVLTGDHTPYSLSQEGLDSLAGHEVDTDFELYKSTCIMWNGSIKEPIYVDDYCCNVDIYPTILNLFGMDFDSRLMAGRDIFSDSTHAAVLYNRSFITPEVKYNNSTGKAIWADSNTWTEEERQEYLDKYIVNIRNTYSMCLKMESSDYYGFVWEHTVFK